MPKFQEPPVTLADPALVEKATQLLKSAKRPLVIVGKGKAGGEITQWTHQDFPNVWFSITRVSSV